MSRRPRTHAPFQPYITRAFRGDPTPHRPSVRGRVVRRTAGALAVAAIVASLIPALAGISVPTLSVSCDPTRVGLATTCRATITDTTSTSGITLLGTTQTKAIAGGVFTRDGVPVSAEPVRIATKKIYWDTLEATRDVVTLAPIENVLDTAEARGFDGVRLRFSFGVDAPQWAKAIADGPIDYVEPQSNIIATIPDVWDPAYQAEVEELMTAVAAKYDADPRVLLVFASGAQTYYSEPFIRGITEQRNRTNLLAAGYTKALDQAAEKWQLDIMRVFHQTPVGLAYNPWQYVNADGSGGGSVAFMAEVMDYHLSLFGNRTVLQNNSVRSSYISDPPPMYAEFLSRLARPGTTQFQLAGATRVGDADAAMQWAIDYLKASGVELVNGYPEYYTDAQLTSYDTALVSNVTPSAPEGVAWSTSGGGYFSGSSCAPDGIGVTTCSVRYLPRPGTVGEHTITATYTGSALSLAPVSVQLRVWKRASTTTLACTTPVPAGGTSRCTATVTDETGGEVIVPTGTITIAADGVEAGSCALGAGSGPTSTCAVDVSATAGTHQVTASYGGDADHFASTSGSAQVTVESPPAEEPPAEEPPAEEPPADTTAPAVQILSPADGASLPRGVKVALTAAVSDDVGVTRLVFEINGSVKCSLTQPAWTCQWTPPKGKTGTFTIVARAFDAAGNSSSTQISVTTIKG